ncbi:MAG: hypothetical protein PHD13_06450 [Methanocellales archaeon]|nr:hypothetical protein [Methanocellales archaeon]MDD3291891.1 hypothetical protein [Methanocellales archaeon]MDD5235798.1 hypothetical protein [Methanocellales archaeon]MDD5485555.1 hypothetical protein [Methanocellales archaeon]
MSRLVTACFCMAILISLPFFIPVNVSGQIHKMSPGISLSAYVIDAEAGEHDNEVEYTIRAMSESTVTENVKLSINESSPDYSIIRDYSFSESNFDLSPGSTKNVTLSLTIEYGTDAGNKTITVDSNASFTIGSTTYYDLSYTSFYVEVISPVTPYSAPVALPELNMMGLMILIGILSVVLATVMVKRE